MSVDYTGIFTTAVNQAITGINAVLPVAISILGIMTAIGIGVKLYKKFAH